MTQQQYDAANPLTSVWVGASAGTGKTKVLTDRVLRLLLFGVPATKILCLTFTKAAAAEMRTRIVTVLSSWIQATPEALSETLTRLTGEPPTEATLKRARQLFAMVVDNPEALCIQTLHAFSQTLLKRFSVEAGIGSATQLMDDQAEQQLLSSAIAALFQLAGQGSQNELATALRIMSEHIDSSTFLDFIRVVVDSREGWETMLRHYTTPEQASQKVATLLGVEGLTEALLFERLCVLSAEREQLLRQLVKVLSEEKGIRAQESAEILAHWVNASVEQRKQYTTIYNGVFLTQDGQPRKQLLPKAIAERYPDLEQYMLEEQQRILHWCDDQKALHTATLTTHLYRFIHAFWHTYHALKHEQALLDYDDLISLCCQLLTNTEATPWVLFKLDGGIDHILVDEAQDTSPLQWEIIKALAQSFYLGTAKTPLPPTLMVVGDPKQSIYSFQGADPASFYHLATYFQQQAQAMGMPYQTIHLSHSFRSAPAVLEVVDHVCNSPALQAFATFRKEKIVHFPTRTHLRGRVELWPLIAMSPAEEQKQQGWKLPLSYQLLPSSSRLTAQYIARTICHWLQTKRMLSGRNRAVEAGDILILVRRRNHFVEEMIQELKRLDVPVAGCDRIQLNTNLAVQDVVALAQFCLLPTDDLTLATVLKTPFLGWTEEQLFTLCHDRGERSVWEKLQVGTEEPLYKTTLATLTRWRELALQESPYGFFAQLLDQEGGRKALYSRLGLEVADPIDEFLALVLQYEQKHIPSLQGFLAWFAQSTIDIKRDNEHPRRQVCVMTVHAAKGLQAPIVFLPDTVQLPQSDTPFVWLMDEEHTSLPVWAGRTSQENHLCSRMRSLRNEHEYEEYLRLLYVALTRAEDELYICGWQPATKPSEKSWYHILANTLAALGKPSAMPTLFAAFAADAKETQRIIYGEEEEPLPSTSTTITETVVPQEMLEFLRKPVTHAYETVMIEKPSYREEISSLFEEEEWKKLEGTIVHQLLQYVTMAPPGKLEPYLHFLLQRFYPHMQEHLKHRLIHEVLELLQEPTIQHYLCCEGLNEVPIAGWILRKGKRQGRIYGFIDRLIKTKDAVHIIDYKTTLLQGKSLQQVKKQHIRQLSAYRYVIHHIYPDVPIHCTLIGIRDRITRTIDPVELDHYFPLMQEM